METISFPLFRLQEPGLGSQELEWELNIWNKGGFKNDVCLTP